MCSVSVISVASGQAILKNTVIISDIREALKCRRNHVLWSTITTSQWWVNVAVISPTLNQPCTRKFYSKNSFLWPATFCHQRLFLSSRNKVVGDRIYCIRLRGTYMSVHTQVFSKCAWILFWQFHTADPCYYADRTWELFPSCLVYCHFYISRLKKFYTIQCRSILNWNNRWYVFNNIEDDVRI